MFFRWLYNNGGTFRNVGKFIAEYDMYGYVSNTTLKCYYESCLVDNLKPTLGGYFTKILRIKFKPLRYCGLRFKFAARKSPHKYFVNRSDIKQLPDAES